MKYLLFLLTLASCHPDKKYTVYIKSVDAETKRQSEQKKEFKAKNDSSAYQQACKHYWIAKALALQQNRRFEGYSNLEQLPEPFFFSLENNKGRVVAFPKDIAERLTAETVNYFKEKVIPFIDTITPLKDREKEEPANIY